MSRSIDQEVKMYFWVWLILGLIFTPIIHFTQPFEWLPSLGLGLFASAVTIGGGWVCLHSH